MQRREFMQLSVAFAALCMSEVSNAARALFIYDARFPAARGLIKEGGLQNAVHVPVSGDLVRGWRDLVRTHSGGPAIERIVAVTLHSDSVLLRQLAAGQGLKLVRSSKVMATRSGASKPVALITCLFERRGEMRA